MKSRLFTGDVPLVEPELCGAGRRRLVTTIQFGDKTYTIVKTDQPAPEDFYLVAVKANAYAIRNGIEYPGRDPNRQVRDFLIKNNVVPGTTA